MTAPVDLDAIASKLAPLAGGRLIIADDQVLADEVLAIIVRCRAAEAEVARLREQVAKRAHPLDVHCIACGSRPQEACVGLDGNERHGHHGARINDALAKVRP